MKVLVASGDNLDTLESVCRLLVSRGIEVEVLTTDPRFKFEGVKVNHDLLFSSSFNAVVVLPGCPFKKEQLQRHATKYIYYNQIEKLFEGLPSSSPVLVSQKPAPSKPVRKAKEEVISENDLFDFHLSKIFHWEELE